MGDKDKILDFIRAKGPSLPTSIAKEIAGNSIFVSAHLSEMKEQGKIKISNVKVGGGSPLYYLPGQQNLLQNFSNNLGEKEKKVYELLKEKKVVRDSSLVPVFRAAIRTIKDFAFPLNININGGKELFWKWYLLSNDDAIKIVRQIMGIKDKKEEVKKEETKKTVQNKPIQKEEEKAQETKPQVKKEEQQKITDDEKKKSVGEFYDEIINYFSNNNIKVVEENFIRKTEIDFIVSLPTPVGEMKYFVKAKSKKKLNDGDLSSAFIQGQMKKLSVLFLGKGDLTKKAQEMLENEFKSMKYNKI